MKTKDCDNLKEGFFAKLKAFFKNLRVLTAMQFKDQIDFSFLKSKRKTFAKILYSIIMFLVVTIVIQTILSLVVQLGLFSFVRILNYRVYLVLMTVLLILSFIACIVKVTTTLYFSKDNLVLITLPVNNSMIFTSKLVVCYIYELIKNVSYLLPFFFAYGMVMNFGILYYVWSVFSLIIFTLLSVVLSGLLSIPAMVISIILKRHKWLELSLITVLGAFVVYLLVNIIGAIPSDIDLIRDWGRLYWNIQDFLAWFAKTFFIFDYLLQLFTGMLYNGTEFNPFRQANVLTLELIFLTCVISIALIYLLSKPLFLKMISSPFEYKKKINRKSKRNRRLPAFLSAVVQQSKRIFRTPNLIYSVLAVAVITPLAVFCQNKIIGAMDTRMFGNYLGITFNVLIVLLLTLSSNTSMASVYSREGNSAYLNKINPVEYHVPLSAKIVLNGLLNVISIIVSCIIINNFANLGIKDTILLTIAMVLLYLGHLLWSAELDIMNPQNHHYQTTGSHNKNPNELKSTIIGFITSAIFTLAIFTFLQEEYSSVFGKLLLISVIYFTIRVYFYFNRVKLYYGEK